jgi:hypothetical protein
MNDNTAYTIRVKGHLDDHWSPLLADLALLHNQDGTTTLTGVLADQAQLHGVLARLRDINAVLLDVHATSTSETSHDPRNGRTPTRKLPAEGNYRRSNTAPPHDI